MSEPLDDATDHLLGETDEAKFWGKPQLFANRVWRIYSQDSVARGFVDRKGGVDPQADEKIAALSEPGKALRQNEPKTKPRKEESPTMPRAPTSQIEVLAAITSGARSRAEIAKTTGRTPTDVKNILGRMIKLGRVTSAGVVPNDDLYPGPNAAEIDVHAAVDEEIARAAGGPALAKRVKDGKASRVVPSDRQPMPNFATGYPLPKDPTPAADPAIVILEQRLADLDAQRAKVNAALDARRGA